MNKLKEKAYQFKLELFKYITRNPYQGGMELLEQFDKLFLNEDLIFCSKEELKDKLNIHSVENEHYVTFETGLYFRKTIPLYDLRMSNIAVTDIEKLTKEEFIRSLEIDWLDKHFI